MGASLPVSDPAKRKQGRPRTTGLGGKGFGNPAVQVRLPPDLHGLVSTRGGARWVRELIDCASKALDVTAAANEADSVSRAAILGAGQGALLAAHGYLAILALGYECAAPTRADAEKFLRLLQD